MHASNHNFEPPVTLFTETLKSCPVCRSDKFQEVFNELRDNIPLKFSKCVRCNALFQNPRPSAENLTRYFDNFAGSLLPQQENESPADDCLDKIRFYLPPPARLLELGGGAHGFLNRAKSAGYHAEEAGISDTLALRVTGLHRIKSSITSIEEIDLPESLFDVVCSFGGIASWHDPRYALRNISRLLSPEGLFCFNYSDYQSLAVRLQGKNYFGSSRTSLVLYTRSALHRLLQDYGFKWLYEGKEVPSPGLKHIRFERLFKLFGKGRRFVIAQKRDRN